MGYILIRTTFIQPYDIAGNTDNFRIEPEYGACSEEVAKDLVGSILTRSAYKSKEEDLRPGSDSTSSIGPGTERRRIEEVLLMPDGLSYYIILDRGFNGNIFKNQRLLVHSSSVQLPELYVPLNGKIVHPGIPDKTGWTNKAVEEEGKPYPYTSKPFNRALGDMGSTSNECFIGEHRWEISKTLVPKVDNLELFGNALSKIEGQAGIGSIIGIANNVKTSGLKLRDFTLSMEKCTGTAFGVLMKSAYVGGLLHIENINAIGGDCGGFVFYIQGYPYPIIRNNIGNNRGRSGDLKFIGLHKGTSRFFIDGNMAFYFREGILGISEVQGSFPGMVHEDEHIDSPFGRSKNNFLIAPFGYGRPKWKPESFEQTKLYQTFIEDQYNFNVEVPSLPNNHMKYVRLKIKVYESSGNMGENDWPNAVVRPGLEPEPWGVGSIIETESGAWGRIWEEKGPVSFVEHWWTPEYEIGSRPSDEAFKVWKTYTAEVQLRTENRLYFVNWAGGAGPDWSAYRDFLGNDIHLEKDENMQYLTEGIEFEYDVQPYGGHSLDIQKGFTGYNSVDDVGEASADTATFRQNYGSCKRLQVISCEDTCLTVTSDYFEVDTCLLMYAGNEGMYLKGKFCNVRNVSVDTWNTKNTISPEASALTIEVSDEICLEGMINISQKAPWVRGKRAMNFHAWTQQDVYVDARFNIDSEDIMGPDFTVVGPVNLLQKTGEKSPIAGEAVNRTKGYYVVDLTKSIKSLIQPKEEVEKYIPLEMIAGKAFTFTYETEASIPDSFYFEVEPVSDGFVYVKIIGHPQQQVDLGKITLRIDVTGDAE